jgi:hypothetical protein
MAMIDSTDVVYSLRLEYKTLRKEKKIQKVTERVLYGHLNSAEYTSARILKISAWGFVFESLCLRITTGFLALSFSVSDFEYKVPVELLCCLFYV